jgi:hypothetical protein
MMLVAAYVLIPVRMAAWRGFLFVLLAFVVFADLFTADRVTIAEQKDATGGAVVISETDLGEYYRPSGAAQFLQANTSEEEPFRYFGYDPGLGEWSHVSSPARFADPGTRALEANGRSMLLGLQNIQGYNPTHIARYDEFMSALNGAQQNYHFIDVYAAGLNSPLLNLLNARYIIVPTHPSQENSENLKQFERFELTHPTVYEDEQTKVLKNQQALPRAWIVHSARQEESQRALDLLSSGEVDPKKTALLEGEPPQGMSEPEDASADRASVEEYGANRIRLKTDTQAAGLLMLSEVYYPAWKAYVDGQEVSEYVADGLLRAVAVPAGEHTVEFRYESWALWVGIAISLVAYAVLVALAVAAGVQRWRKRASNSFAKSKTYRLGGQV